MNTTSMRLLQLKNIKNKLKPIMISLSILKSFLKEIWSWTLVYDQDNDTLGVVMFTSMWAGPYIIKHFLSKGAYESVQFLGLLR